jgi:hypothetical protein
MVTAVKKEKKMVSVNEITQGYSLKFLVNGVPINTETVTTLLCTILDKMFAPQRVRWQGWVFEGSMIVILTITRPTSKELASFLRLAESLWPYRSISYITEEVVPLSAPGTLRFLSEVIP